MARRCSNPLLYLFHYTTVKYVVTQNKKVGLLYRFFQLIIVCYLIGWVFVTKKGYQAVDDNIESSVVTKVKGTARVNTSYSDLWGPEEYVIPDHGGKYLFIVTNFIETPNQTLTTCPESPSVPFGKCTHDDNCTEGEAVRAGNGIKTGTCRKTDGNETNTCEIYGWCPTEKPKRPGAATMLREAENFTVYIRIFIKFSQFNLSKRNILKEKNSSYIKSCLHDEIHHPYCPVFRLGDIVSKAGYRFEEVAAKGGSIGIAIRWSCDLDMDTSDCHPQYSFMSMGSSTPVKAGYNFRFARYYSDAAGKTHRTLYKVYGFQLDIMVFGTASQFSIIHTIINVASVLTLMAVGSYICDVILLFMVKKKYAKFESLIKADKEITLQKMPDHSKRKFSF
ncbi:purinergic receptor P2X, ligand-gated ion channel, 8 [Danio aesculapii]|uniref:purinergic receptor P2X, ligand-gated ion channel, 8 n=1 Tax=Danio aesculapii TaxID=1142201 RepID=UPI0024BFC83F|nr:purinergic receptor P2X, ligand-gated ion channel, 8 [Danio aesculapii]